MKIKEHIQQKLDTLNDKQLLEVDNFINLLQFKSNLLNQEHYNLNKIAELYQEFAEEDRLLAEEGCAEYAELLEKVELGEEILISDRDIPIAKLVPIRTSSYRMASLGQDRGKFIVPEDFNDPLPEDILAAFGGNQE